jgi:hypothetical protein
MRTGSAATSENGTFVTAEKYMSLHEVSGMVLLCEEWHPLDHSDLESDPVAVLWLTQPIAEHDRRILGSLLSASRGNECGRG